jgi:hypothetical protein
MRFISTGKLNRIGTDKSPDFVMRSGVWKFLPYPLTLNAKPFTLEGFNPAYDPLENLPKRRLSGSKNLEFNILHAIFMTLFHYHSNILMKRPSLILSITALLFSAVASAQNNVIKLESCNSGSIQSQADSLKQLYSKDGFILLREASVSMQSEYELPVVVPLMEGSWYQFVFIGDYSSKLYEVRMYDWDEKMVVYLKKQWGDIDGNIISYSYIPKITEPHMIKPVQVNKQKKKDLCGYVMLFKKTGAPPTASTGK